METKLLHVLVSWAAATLGSTVNAATAKPSNPNIPRAEHRSLESLYFSLVPRPLEISARLSILASFQAPQTLGRASGSHGLAALTSHENARPVFYPSTRWHINIK